MSAIDFFSRLGKNGKRLIEILEETNKPKKKKNYYETRKENKKKGTDFEIFVGKIYQKQGYKVFFNGIANQKNDNGVDLVAHKENEIILIQCKHWEKKEFKHNHLKEFLGNCEIYLNKNKHFKKKEIKKVYCTSRNNLHISAKILLEKNKDMIIHEHINF